MASTGEVWKLGHRPALDGVRGITAALVVLVVACALGVVQPSTAQPPAAASGALVLFLDDCTSDQFGALTAVEARGGRVTFACPSGWIGQPGHMTAALVANASRRGHEIAAHSASHPRMTDLSPAARVNEWDAPLHAIESWTGDVPTDWVYPYSDSDAATDAEGLTRYRRTFTGESAPHLVSLDERPPRTLGRFSWNSETQREFLRLIRRAGRSGLVLVAYVHQVDGSSPSHGVSMREFDEAMDGAALAGVRLVTADALAR